jgi:pimeloyl-ACP methyl ester carboxylesterase
VKGQGSHHLRGAQGLAQRRPPAGLDADPAYRVPVRTVDLPDGRVLAYDDAGDAAGLPVIYLHGTPDSRHGRPDDAGAVAARVRLLAVDRPGFGDSDVDPAATLISLGDDLAQLLDAAEVVRAALVGWSGGGLAALGAATNAVLGPRLASIGLIGTLPPAEAYDDPEVLAALGDGRRALAEIAREMSAAELAANVAPYLVPDPIDEDIARAHVLELSGEVGRAELARAPGSVEALTAGLMASVQRGVAGLAGDIERQLERGIDLAAITGPVRTFHGSLDDISPPQVGTWLVARLPNAVLDLSPDSGHHLLFPRWRGILQALRRDAGL